MTRYKTKGVLTEKGDRRLRSDIGQPSETGEGRKGVIAHKTGTVGNIGIEVRAHIRAHIGEEGQTITMVRAIEGSGATQMGRGIEVIRNSEIMEGVIGENGGDRETEVEEGGTPMIGGNGEDMATTEVEEEVASVTGGLNRSRVHVGSSILRQ